MSNKYNTSVTASIFEGFVKGFKKGLSYGYNKEIVNESVSKLKRKTSTEKQEANVVSENINKEEQDTNKSNLSNALIDNIYIRAIKVK